MANSKMRVNSAWWEFRPVLMAREPFETYGSLRGIRCDSEYVRANRGRLPDQFGQPMPIPGSIDYAVYSYATPIAWHLAATGEWVVPDVTYSATTTRQQNRMRTALFVTDEQYREARECVDRFRISAEDGS